MGKNYNEKQKQAIEEAVKYVKENLNVIKSNENFKKFSNERKDIFAVANERTPFIREYFNLLKEAEKRSGTYFERVKTEMHEVAARQEVLKKAAELCTDEASKEELLQEREELNNHPAMAAYGKYVEGLKYFAGMTDELKPEVEMFFEKELRFKFVKNLNYPEGSLLESYRKGEQPNLKIFDTDKPITEEEERKVKAYQEAIAEAKAKEVFTRQQIHHLPLEEQFLGDYIQKRDANKVALPSGFNNRVTPTAFCVGRMLADGCSLEEIMDPRALLEKKKEIGEEYKGYLERGDAKTYGEKMYEGSKAIKKAFLDYVKKHKDELKSEKDLAMHGNRLITLSCMASDLLQELPRVKDYVKKISPDDMDKMADDLSKLNCCTVLSVGTCISYNPYKIGWSDVSSIMTNQIFVNTFLDEVQKENPDLENHMMGAMQEGDINNHVAGLGELKELFGNSDDINMNKLEDDQISDLASMMNYDFIRKNDIRAEYCRIPLKVMEKPKYDAPINYEKGDEMKVVVTCKGKQLLKTNAPHLSDRQLKRLERKNIRGKESNNSEQFNALLRSYDEVAGKIGHSKIDNKEYLEELNKLKKSAIDYLNAKRAQKGHAAVSGDLPEKIDKQMLGLEKGASIFTNKGKARYDLALKVVMNIQAVEKAFHEYEKKNPTVEKENNNQTMKIKENIDDFSFDK